MSDVNMKNWTKNYRGWEIIASGGKVAVFRKSVSGWYIGGELYTINKHGLVLDSQDIIPDNIKRQAHSEWCSLHDYTIFEDDNGYIVEIRKGKYKDYKSHSALSIFSGASDNFPEVFREILKEPGIKWRGTINLNGIYAHLKVQDDNPVWEIESGGKTILEESFNGKIHDDLSKEKFMMKGYGYGLITRHLEAVQKAEKLREMITAGDLLPDELDSLVEARERLHARYQEKFNKFSEVTGLANRLDTDTINKFLELYFSPAKEIVTATNLVFKNNQNLEQQERPPAKEIDTTGVEHVGSVAATDDDLSAPMIEIKEKK